MSTSAAAPATVEPGPRATLNKWGAWRGSSTGRFHIDFAGMKTDPAFWPALKPTRAGPVRIALPRFGVHYLEVLATTASILAAQGRYSVLEAGAGWGAVAVRAVLLARRLQLPAHAMMVEPIPINLQRIGKHMAVNGLLDTVHRRIGAAISAADGLTWMKLKSTDTLGAREIEPKEVESALAVAPGAAPAWPGTEVALRGDAKAICVPALRLESLLRNGPAIDLLHMRFGGSLGRVVGDAPSLRTKARFVLMPSLPDSELDQADAQLGKLGFAPVFVAHAGLQLRDGATALKMEQGFGFWANTALVASGLRQRTANDFATFLV